MSATKYTSLPTAHGIATIWEARPAQWNWTLGGSEGCGCESFDEALAEAMQSVEEAEVEA